MRKSPRDGGRGEVSEMESVEVRKLVSGPTEITFEVVPQDGRIETAQEIVKKICEANKGCSLRIEVKDISY